MAAPAMPVMDEPAARARASVAPAVATSDSSFWQAGALGWPVSLRERYGFITLGEVARFYLVCWDSRRNLRRRRRRAAAARPVRWVGAGADAGGRRRGGGRAAAAGAAVDAVGAV